MISRKTTITHRLGGTTDLPLLIPAFSSKGFDFFAKGKGKHKHTFSEITHALEAMGPFLQESFLVSAYDLHHKHFRDAEGFFRNAALVFIDSGGYELNPEFDSTEPKITPTRALPFTAEDYDNLLTRLYDKFGNVPLVVTNFDWSTRNRPFEEQIKEGRRLFHKFPNWSHNFLIKPNRPSRSVLDVDELVPDINDLRGFDIIGVTEKELGKNLIDRLRRLAKLRVELSRRDITAPVHVWGGLDPVITPLYFFAGADLFDGVSWLRYVYHNGVAVNRDCYGILDGNLATSHDHAVMLALNRNLIVLQGLATSLRAFANSSDPNFDVFDNNRDVLEKAYRTLRTKVTEVKEFG